MQQARLVLRTFKMQGNPGVHESEGRFGLRAASQIIHRARSRGHPQAQARVGQRAD